MSEGDNKYFEMQENITVYFTYRRCEYDELWRC